VLPIAAVAGLCAEGGVPLHVDAVQAASGIDIDVGALPGDVTVALAAHKLGGPKAVGVLAGRGLRSLAPVLHGGGQERGLRPGTENVAGAVAMAAVLERRQGAGAPAERAARRARRDRLEAACGVAVAGAGAERLPGHACLLCDDVRGDVLVHVLDAEGFCVAAGSACAAGSAEPSPVLTAMGLDARQARSALRVSIGPETTDDDVDAFVPALRGALATLRVAAAGVA
jgi:cysteine desulfurase